jgi:hypothetical protein
VKVGSQMEKTLTCESVTKEEALILYRGVGIILTQF